MSRSLPHTALLLSDVQTQILARFPKDIQDTYLAQILTLLNFFRAEVSKARSTPKDSSKTSLYDDVPLIIHHTLPFNLNHNAFVSPYNKLSRWVKSLEEKGFFANAPSDPNTPHFGVPSQLVPPNGWSKDEIVLGKLAPNCFASSDLLAYLRARGIKHVVLVGLTTMGSVLGSARAGADLDFHIICPREGIREDVGNEEIDELIMTKLLPKFVDVVKSEDILALHGEQ
jgi:nicotinamidase-related amidase